MYCCLTHLVADPDDEDARKKKNKKKKDAPEVASMLNNMTAKRKDDYMSPCDVKKLNLSTFNER